MSPTRRFKPPDLLSREEAAEIFGIPTRTLRAWEDTGRLPVVRLLTGHRRYRREDVEELVRKRTDVTPPPEPEAPPVPEPTRFDIRRAALEALHAGDVAGVDDPAGHLPAYARTLVDGVRAHREQIDALITEAAERWTVDRMPVVDRNVLRIAVFELLYTEVPTGAVVDQAVTLAKLLSTEGSGRFVNGLLGRIAREHR